MILGIIVIALVTVGFIEYSAQPSFCVNCHNMRPYYESWASSSHNQVKCIECHYAPGIKAEAMGKLQAANQVVKYVTGAYGTKPWAEIEDAACTRAGCHAYRKLEGEIDFNGTRFNHAHHLTELRRGKQLRCTSCHSQIVQGEHLAVTAETCFLCHFRDQPEGEPIAGCTGCHPSPPRMTTDDGFLVDHPQYVEDMVSCMSCHDDVSSGTGEADPARCQQCHNEPERLALFSDTTRVHAVHLAEHNIECALCHTLILHRVESLDASFDLDCASCHQRAHETQKRLFTGRGGHGTEDEPSAMFRARVSCESCHGLPTEVEGHEQVQRAGEATCLSCHGIQYANILPAWQEEMERKLDLVASVVAGARASRGTGSSAARATADSLLALATDNVELVRVGRAAHNIVYADALLRAALGFVDEATRIGGLAYRPPAVELGQPVGENMCLRCHLGIEQRAGSFDGLRFEHAPHLLDSGLPCSVCHTPLDEHGGITLTSKANCMACHHSGVIACETCHADGGGIPGGTLRLPQGDFSHSLHIAADLTCSTCHGGAPTGGAVGCDTCHENHHRPEATCVSCHREGTQARHTVAAHTLCSTCHGEKIAAVTEWSRNICETCHTDRVAHFAPNKCTGCHQVPPMQP
jgi:nitrate/TMAO reductase-like tetraheme cytochrome c subunit